MLIIALILIGDNQFSVAGAQGSKVTPTPDHQTQIRLTESMRAMLADQQPPEALTALPRADCLGGMAASYRCQNIDLLAFLPLSDIGGGNGNESWGWTDPLDGKEFALMGRTNGTAFIDISDPEDPVYLGDLPSHTGNASIWRDIKVYAAHAFIVADGNPGHGMQVFDLTQLRSISAPPTTFANTAHYSDFSTAHNIVINEDSGYAYAVGTDTCDGGMHFIDISTPTAPTFAGCYGEDGHTHDAQCVNYMGPDPDHIGKEICLNANEDTLTIVDVSDKSAPVLISRTSYAGFGFVHQGWLTEDQRYYLLDDELDEINNEHNTRTYGWDLSNLDDPLLIATYTAAVAAVDHNQYIVGDLAFQANYRAGLRILDLSKIESGDLTEVAFFDIYPPDDNPNFNGAWNVYPFFDSGVVIVSGIEQGLFILKPRWDRAYFPLIFASE